MLDCSLLPLPAPVYTLLLATIGTEASRNGGSEQGPMEIVPSHLPHLLNEMLPRGDRRDGKQLKKGREDANRGRDKIRIGSWRGLLVTTLKKA